MSWLQQLTHLSLHDLSLNRVVQYICEFSTKSEMGKKILGFTCPCLLQPFFVVVRTVFFFKVTSFCYHNRDVKKEPAMGRNIHFISSLLGLSLYLLESTEISDIRHCKWPSLLRVNLTSGLLVPYPLFYPFFSAGNVF